MANDPGQARPAAPESRERRDDQQQQQPAHRNGQGQRDAHSDLPDIDIPSMGTGAVIAIVIGFAILLGAILLVGLVPHYRRVKMIEAEASRAQRERPLVATTRPYRADRAPQLILPGDARAFQTTAIFARATGYLKDQRVDIGDHVKTGQLLAQLEIPEVDAQLLSAKAMLEQAKAAAGRAEDDFKLSQSTLDRYEGLSNSGGVTQQQLDEKRNAFTQARSALSGAQATVRADEADVQRLTALQGFAQITAPFSGTISSRNFDVGALVTASNTSDGREMYRLQDTDTLRVFVNVPQTYAEQVKVSDEAEFLVPNYPGRAFKGKIARTSGSIDQNTRTLRVEADFPNPDGSLLPGMYGDLHYSLKQSESTPLMVPTSALVLGGEGLRVASVDADDRVKFLKIMPGRDLGTEMEVVGGLTGDERIISNPGERLVDGLAVATSDGEQKSTAQGGKSDAGRVAEGDSRR